MTSSDTIRFLAERNTPTDLWRMASYAIRFRRSPAIRGHWRAMVRNYLAALRLQAAMRGD